MRTSKNNAKRFFHIFFPLTSRSQRKEKKKIYHTVTCEILDFTQTHVYPRNMYKKCLNLNVQSSRGRNFQCQIERSGWKGVVIEE